MATSRRILSTYLDESFRLHNVYRKFPDLEIETDVGLRYTPDLIVIADDRKYPFWGECGQNSIRKTAWLLKHTRLEKMVLFKIGMNIDSLIKQHRNEIPTKYRLKNRLILINFVSEIIDLTNTKEIEKVSNDWYSEIEI